MTAKAVDLSAQALKALSERCPFETEEFVSRSPTLPFRVSRHLSSRKKLKKAAAAAATNGGGETADASAAAAAAGPQLSKQSKGGTWWEEMEVYFRPISESDIESLKPRPLPDSCFFIPKIEGTEVGVSLNSVSEVEEKSEKAEDPMEIDSVDNSVASTLPIKEEKEGEEEEDEGLSLSWVVGSKHRAILTTQRPNKKRKLLGSDAGLDQLVALPHSDAGAVVCDVCCLGETEGKSNKIISCSQCRVLVHKRCYGMRVVDGSWVCSWCEHLKGMEDEKRGERPCLLCSKQGGALKPVGGDPRNDGKFAHLFCCLWTPEVYVKDSRAMEPIVNVWGVPEMRRKLVCNVCKVKHGVCVRCSHGTCRAAFHPICARDSRHQMEIWGKFGCDNVELRAFCSKHSTSQDVGSAQRTRNFTQTVSQDVGSSQCTRNLTQSVDDEFSVAKPLPAPLLPKKIPKLKFSRKSKEKNMTCAEVTSSISSEVVENNAFHEQDALATKLSPEDGHMQSSKNLDTLVTERNSSLPDFSNLIPVVKKLISRGKIIVGDVASDLGISSHSLEVALMGEISSIPTELRLKVAKWFQESIYMPAALKFRNGSAISASSLAARVGLPNAPDVLGSDISGNIEVAHRDNAAVCSAKSLSSDRIMNNHTRALEEHKTACISVEKNEQSSNGELVDEISHVPVIQTNDIMEDNSGNMSPFQGQHQYRDLGDSEMITEDACTFPNLSSQIRPPEVEGNLTTVQKEWSETQHEPECTVDFGLSAKLENNQADEANFRQEDAAKGKRSCGSCSSYVHPSIQKRLMQTQKGVPFMGETIDSYSNGHIEDRMSSPKATDSCNRSSSPVCSDLDRIHDSEQFKQIATAKQMGILECSPEDEVEGEMLYLQNKLLNNAFQVKHSLEDLLGRIVKGLPQELDALKQRQWDLVLLNQYHREVTEAKKWGRKERKHREAQAVLAAAAAAAAASSRNPLLRKDGNDEVGSPHVESPQNVSSLPGRASRQSLARPRLKETPRSAIVNVSPDKHSSIFQLPEFSKENSLSCNICRRSETLLNRISVCSSCKLAVHLDCYRKLKDPVGPWKCELCEEMSQLGSPRNQTVECGLCGSGTGAFRKATNDQWVHAFCAEWLLESTFRRGQENLIEGMDVISKEKDLLTCCICQQKFGFCLKCSYGHCQAAFHPNCARAAGFYMDVKTTGGRPHHKAYCEKHSVEQRQKADNQKYGAEELKSLKQIRLELEKVRILCERIVKREKVKRDLVLCAHDILASRKDHAAYSTHVRGSFCPPGASSESVTTSLDNKSFSETIQRSEDITVDSEISGKRRIKISMDLGRKIDDNSTSQPSFKRKIADRTSCSGKQLPHRTQTVSFRNSACDGEKKFKARKNPETFHKEVVMTSHQASMQNRRLPKGFVYVPIDSLSKENQEVHESPCHEPEEPAGGIFVDRQEHA